LARVIDRAIDPDPRRRYPPAEALAAGLLPLRRRSPLASWSRRAALAAVLLLGVGGAWLLRGTQAAMRDRAHDRSPLAAQGGLASGGADRPAAEPVIVVLPFRDSVVPSEPGPAADPVDGDYFTIGIADEIIRDLARVDGLEVRSRHSSFAIAGSGSLREIGERLSANLVVTGSVLRSGDRLRVNAELVDTSNEVALWTRRFDRKLSSSLDVFAIVDEIAAAVVNELRLTLGSGRRRYDVDLHTYELYLHARTLIGVGGPRAEQAAAMFEQVIAHDPAFAPAYAGLADAHFFLSNWIEGDAAQVHPAMRRAAERALELDPTLSATYTHYSISTLLPLGRLDEAERLLQGALEQDPLSLDVQLQLSYVEFFGGRYGAAIDRLEGIYQVDPDLNFVRLQLLRALTFAGRLPEAFAMIEEIHQLGRAAPPFEVHALLRSGRRAEAEHLAAEVADDPYRAALSHAVLGEVDRAFAALEWLTREEPQKVPLLLHAPELAPLRGDPRFAALCRKLGVA
jgi:TolB-like protein